jgi:hypothetical protein
MLLYLSGNTGFCTAQRESEILQSFTNRLHSFGKHLYLGDQDVAACLDIIRKSGLKTPKISKKYKKKVGELSNQLLFQYAKNSLTISGAESIEVQIKIKPQIGGDHGDKK